MRFELKMGVEKPNNQESYKFLGFLLWNQKEEPVWTAKKVGLCERPMISPKSEYEYETDVEIVKIFVSEVKFGLPTLTYSFYIKLMPMKESMQTITIRPFNPNVRDKFFFSASGKFMKHSEILPYLDPNGMSAKCLGSGRISTDALKQMITVTCPKTIDDMKKVRVLRINDKKERNNESPYSA